MTATLMASASSWYGCKGRVVGQCGADARTLAYNLSVEGHASPVGQVLTWAPAPSFVIPCSAALRSISDNRSTTSVLMPAAPRFLVRSASSCVLTSP